jgi:carbon storage regulator CsrA
MEEKTMLVLSRKENQAIHIGDNIKLTVLRVRGKTIRIGVEAPEDVRILRGELAEWHELSVGKAGLSEEAAVAC